MTQARLLLRMLLTASPGIFADMPPSFAVSVGTLFSGADLGIVVLSAILQEVSACPGMPTISLVLEFTCEINQAVAKLRSSLSLRPAHT